MENIEFSDGPQLNNPPKYVLMACNKNATRGGYSILSSIEKILLHLKKKDKKTLSILKKKFLFEKRGFLVLRIPICRSGSRCNLEEKADPTPF